MTSGSVAATKPPRLPVRDRFEFTSAYADSVCARVRCRTAACLSVCRSADAGSITNACLWRDERSDSKFAPAQLIHFTATELRKLAGWTDADLYLVHTKGSQ